MWWRARQLHHICRFPHWLYCWKWQAITVSVWLWDYRRKSSTGSHYGGRVSPVHWFQMGYLSPLPSSPVYTICLSIFVPKVRLSSYRFILIVIKIASEKCGITGRDLFNQPTFYHSIEWLYPLDWKLYDRSMATWRSILSRYWFIVNIVIALLMLMTMAIYTNCSVPVIKTQTLLEVIHQTPLD